MIKVSKVENRGGVQVAAGKLICGDVGSFGKLMDAEELRGKLRPIIVSETESITPVDMYLEDEMIFVAVIGSEPSTCSARKILSIPEFFSPAQLKMIADGEFKNEDEVIVECEKQYFIHTQHPSENNCIYCGRGWENHYLNQINCREKENEYKIKLDKNNHINIIRAEQKQESWDDVDRQFTKQEGCALSLHCDALMKWLKENYNPPTRK